MVVLNLMESLFMYELSIGLKIGIRDVIIGLEFISFDVF